MLDIHSHLLPGIDDGSQSVEESVSMLAELVRQGVGTVAATPHFYAQHMTPELFFKKRSEAFASIADPLSRMPLDLRLGAEVLYFDGIKNLSGLEKFCICGTDLLLIEMPFSRWSEHTIRGITELNARTGIRIVLAHIDRYFSFQPGRIWKELSDLGILMQVNAESIIQPRIRRKIIRLFKNGCVNFMGSDCHNMTTRPPNISDGFNCIKKKLGADAVSYLQVMENDCFHSLKGII